MFNKYVRSAMEALESAERANSKGDRDRALKRLQRATESIQAAGISLDGVAPKEVPMLPDHEMWGFDTNGGRGFGGLG